MSDQRAGWVALEDYIRDTAREIYIYVLDLKDYLGMISGQRQREFIEVVAAGAREDEHKGFWEAVVAQDKDDLREHLRSFADDGLALVPNGGQDDLFADDFPSWGEDLSHLASLSLGQALVLDTAGWSYVVLSRSGFLDLAADEFTALRKSLQGLLAEWAEAEAKAETP